MALSHFIASDALPTRIAPSPLETRRFGRVIGRLALRDGERTSPQELVALAEASGLDLLVLRYPASEIGWFAALSARAPRVIHADTLVYWGAPPGEIHGAADDDGVVRDARASELNALDELVRAVFDHYPNHYNANPALAGGSALEGYVEWARAYVEASGRAALLTEVGDALAGLCTLDLGDDAEIALIGVRAEHRRHGLAAAMMRAAARRAAAVGARRLLISTQVQNIPVQRVWAGLGLRPEHAFTTLHLHLDRP